MDRKVDPWPDFAANFPPQKKDLTAGLLHSGAGVVAMAWLQRLSSHSTRFRRRAPCCDLQVCRFGHRARLVPRPENPRKQGFRDHILYACLCRAVRDHLNLGLVRCTCWYNNTTWQSLPAGAPGAAVALRPSDRIRPSVARTRADERVGLARCRC
jgi:hypothetical protein